jgi:DNA-binding transcriptional MerR regulator
MTDALPTPAPLVRIGELSDRVGASPTLLRAWERRYGLLQPVRSEGGFRLYGPEDERRVRSMQALLRAGVSARQAAEAVLSTPTGDMPDPVAPPPRIAVDGLEDERSRLTHALAAFDDAGAHAVLDRLLAAYGTETVISGVILPYLVDLGERWADGSATIAEEHFATNHLRGRLLGLARGWDGGRGPRALLACPSGELHDLGLICFGIALRGRGWRITYLGADTPQTTLMDAASRLEPDLIVLAATTASRLRALAADVRTALVPVAIAGRGATQRLADDLDAALLDVDPVTGAANVAADPVTWAR